MNGVLGLTYLALQKDPPPEQRELLGKIQSSGRLLLGIINDILDFSKLDKNKLHLEHVDFSMREVTDSVYDMLHPQAQGKGIGFDIIYDSPEIRDAHLLGDSLRLAQVLLNICGNAIKFTEQGSASLTITATSCCDAWISLRFDVHDTGIGMSEDQAGSVFQPFVQGSTYTTRKYGGTGLGLMIAKLLVELMGGSITVTSTLGQGSHFSFELRFARTIRKPIEDTAASSDEEAVCFEGKRILVAEDNHINQVIIEMLLQQFGCEVVLAENGLLALKALEDGHFDCILMDIQMPEMDGLTCAGLIRQDPRDAVRTIPIIAMTAHAMHEDVEKSMSAGMNAHLTKPVDPKVLCACLKAYLE